MTTQPELAGQTVVVIGGGWGIGLETARRARAEGARQASINTIVQWTRRYVVWCNSLCPSSR